MADTPSNVISIFDRERCEEVEYEPTDQDLLGFLKILGYIQSQSSIMKVDILVDVETVTLVSYYESEIDTQYEDMKRSSMFQYRTEMEMYLPMLTSNLPAEELQDYADIMTNLELAIETLTDDIEEDEDSEDDEKEE
jgi:hypothetical protein